MSYKVQLPAQVAVDSAKQLEANKVTASAEPMNQLLHVQSPTLTKNRRSSAGRAMGNETPGRGSISIPSVPIVAT